MGTRPVVGETVRCAVSVGNGVVRSDGLVGAGPGGVKVTVSLPAVDDEIFVVSITVDVSPWRVSVIRPEPLSGFVV